MAVHGHCDQDLHGYTRRCRGLPSTASHISRSCLIRVDLWRFRRDRATRWEITGGGEGLEAWALGVVLDDLDPSSWAPVLTLGEGHSSFIQAYSLAETPIPNE